MKNFQTTPMLVFFDHQKLQYCTLNIAHELCSMDHSYGACWLRVPFFIQFILWKKTKKQQQSGISSISNDVYLLNLMCSKDKWKTYRFGMTWRWVN